MSTTPPKGYGRNKKRFTTGLKLWIVVVIVNSLALYAASVAAAMIRAVPEVQSTETYLIYTLYAALGLTAFVDALWLDELVFKGSFRKTQLVGRLGLSTKKGETQDIDDVAATMQRSDISFPFSMVLFGLLSYFTFNLVTHDFSEYYSMVGQHSSALRGTDTADTPRRIEAIKKLSMRREIEVLPLLFKTLKREDEIAGWAAWAVGRNTDISRKRRLVGPLMKAAKQGDAFTHRQAIIAMGRLQHKVAASYLQVALGNELDSGEPIDFRLIWALAHVQEPSSMKILERALYNSDEKISRYAAWAIAMHPKADAVPLLEGRLPAAPFGVKCAIVHGLGMIAAEESNLALLHAYKNLPPAQRNELCVSEQLFISPDGKDDRFDNIMMPRETFAMKTLQSMGSMRATTPRIRKIVEPWLDTVTADKNATEATRESATSLLKGIQGKRDDSLNRLEP